MSCLLRVQDPPRLLLYFTVPEFLMSLVHTLWINTKVTSEQPSLKVAKQDIQMHIVGKITLSPQIIHCTFVDP
jgi:hypothetical protein